MLTGNFGQAQFGLTNPGSQLTKRQEGLNFAAQGLRPKVCFKGSTEQLQASPSNTPSPGKPCVHGQRRTLPFFFWICQGVQGRFNEDFSHLPPQTEAPGCAFTFTTRPHDHAFFLLSLECQLSLHYHLCYIYTSIFDIYRYSFLLCFIHMLYFSVFVQEYINKQKAKNCSIPKMEYTCSEIYLAMFSIG